MASIPEDDEIDSFKAFLRSAQIDLELFSDFEDTSLEIASKSENLVSSESPDIGTVDEAACVDTMEELTALNTSLSTSDMDKHLSEKSDMPNKELLSSDSLLKESSKKPSGALQKYAFTKIWIEQQQKNYENNLCEQHKFSKALDEYFLEEEVSLMKVEQLQNVGDDKSQNVQ